MNTKDYEAQAKEAWGETDAYREYEAKSKNLTEEKRAQLEQGLESIFKDFSLKMQSGFAFDSSDTQLLTGKLQTYITDNWYTCTKEIFSALGKMYVNDERFRKNIDVYAVGLAEYISKAIAEFCKN